MSSRPSSYGRGHERLRYDHEVYLVVGGRGQFLVDDECIDVAEELSFNTGNAVKYIWRAGLKPGADADEDLAKAVFYLERERARRRRQDRG